MNDLATHTDLSEVDFLDFGASKGGSIDFAIRSLGGKSGLGVDNDGAKVARMQSLGYACLEADITSLDMPADSVRFVVMSHILEHLPGLDTVRRTIASAARVATDFIYIQGPYFDADDALATQGFKFYWSDWHGHTFHLTTWELIGLLDELGLANYALFGRVPVADSSDPTIHPLASPRDQHDYRPQLHPPKPTVVFAPPLHKQPVYREFVCVVRLRDFEGWNAVVHARRGCEFLDGTLPVG